MENHKFSDNHHCHQLCFIENPKSSPKHTGCWASMSQVLLGGGVPSIGTNLQNMFVIYLFICITYAIIKTTTKIFKGLS